MSIDLPGHGNSEGPCLQTIEEIADWLEKVFVKLKLEKVILDWSLSRMFRDA